MLCGCHFYNSFVFPCEDRDLFIVSGYNLIILQAAKVFYFGGFASICLKGFHSVNFFVKQQLTQLNRIFVNCPCRGSTKALCNCPREATQQFPSVFFLSMIYFQIPAVPQKRISLIVEFDAILRLLVFHINAKRESSSPFQHPFINCNMFSQRVHFLPLAYQQIQYWPHFVQTIRSAVWYRLIVIEMKVCRDQLKTISWHTLAKKWCCQRSSF